MCLAPGSLWKGTGYLLLREPRFLSRGAQVCGAMLYHVGIIKMFLGYYGKGEIKQHTWRQQQKTSPSGGYLQCI